VQLDNQQYIDHALPGRIEHRGREVVKVMLPLVKELAKVEKKSIRTKERAVSPACSLNYHSEEELTA
jgi:hypothetical protein